MRDVCYLRVQLKRSLIQFLFQITDAGLDGADAARLGVPILPHQRRGPSDGGDLVVNRITPRQTVGGYSLLRGVLGR
jgi:hypothetical protein